LSDNSANDGGFVTPAAPVAGDHVTVTGPSVWDSNAPHDLIYPAEDVKVGQDPPRQEHHS